MSSVMSAIRPPWLANVLAKHTPAALRASDRDVT